MDWFLYDGELRHEYVEVQILINNKNLHFDHYKWFLQFKTHSLIKLLILEKFWWFIVVSHIWSAAFISLTQKQLTLHFQKINKCSKSGIETLD